MDSGLSYNVVLGNDMFRKSQNRQLREQYATRQVDQRKRKRSFNKVLIFIGVVIIACGLTYANNPNLLKQVIDYKQTKGVVQEKTPIAKASKPSSPKSSISVEDPTTNMCTGNKLSQLILVSISQRHLWVCDNSTVLYNSPVVTGMENLAADLTPTGTYHIYAKETDLYLRGSDSTGSWNDYVNYWMPFLNNKYGTYGFHDATWRPADAFGNISPYSSNASHGCVELPLATAKWIFGWAQIGTTLTIEA